MYDIQRFDRVPIRKMSLFREKGTVPVTWNSSLATSSSSSICSEVKLFTSAA